MKCARCGSDISEGHLYCEKCGEEIKIVPEFDPEFEMQINETIENMAKDVEEEKIKEEIANFDKKAFEKIDEEDIDFNEDFKDILPHIHVKLSKKGKKNIKFSVGIVLAALCIFILSVLAVNHSQDNSYEYQYREAIEHEKQGDLEGAIYYMEKALAINPENTDGQYLLADYYNQSGQTKSSILILKELIEENPYNLDDVYDSLIQIYENEQDYYEIGNILKNCTSAKILAKYNNYVAGKPVFNKPSGQYDEIISITLSGNTEGAIYYTMDGTQPNVTSQTYENPILLEGGKYTIKAVFINTYGVQSEVETMHYEVDIIPPEEPGINLESGSYDEPQLIEIYYDSDTKVYYTIDGTEPDADSIRYTEPIEMPIGVSNYKFIAINEEGAASEVVKRTYQFSLSQAYLTQELAKQVLLNNLQVNGVIEDQSGHIADKLGNNIYEVQTAVKMSGSVYYIIVEKYVDTTGMVHNTNNIYAINAVTGEAYYAFKVTGGQYTLKAL